MVRRLATTFDVLGRKATLTSYDNATVGSGTVLNQCQFVYNGFGQLVTEYQSHSGPVNTSVTPKVQYIYASGSANTIRPTGMIYPNGRTTSLAYGTAGSIDDSASRAATLGLGDGYSVAYTYLGTGAFAATTASQPSLNWTLVGSSNDPETGDVYVGLDRFSRTKDCCWQNGLGTDLARIQYGYDRASNRIWRYDPVATSYGKAFDEIYAYDVSQRLKQMHRGTLNSSRTALTSTTFGECWTLDATGNWNGYRRDDDGNATWDLVQSRTANPVNELTAITNTVGTAWAQPTYDANGNMTTIPREGTYGIKNWSGLGVSDWDTLSVADTAGLTVNATSAVPSYTATYDAWNRLVRLTDPESSAIIQRNEYDARTFRTARKDLAQSDRHFYYNSGWQCLEERNGNTPGTSTADRQFVWGLRYIDELVCRDRDIDGDGTLNERLYGLQDGNWNVVAVADVSAAVQERYGYDPYGALAVRAADYTVRAAGNFNWETTYCGYRWDQPTGLFAVRHRFYHPRLGMWMSRDPIGYSDGKTLYQYTQSRSLAATDPSGLEGLVLLDPVFNIRPGGPGRDCAACHPVQPWVRSHQPLLQELVDQATPDIQRAIESCQGDPACLRALGDVFQQIASTPAQGFYNGWRGNKCFLWVDDFVRNYPDYDPSSNPIITLGGGTLMLQPLEIDTRDGKLLITSRSALGLSSGGMTAHGVVRVTFNPAGGTPSTGYFDLGSSTHLGNYGGADHWFWPNTPGLGFEVEMDVEHPKPYVRYDQ